MEETEQEYYNRVVTKKMAKRIAQLLDEEDATHEYVSFTISEEFPDIIKNLGRLDGMYLEYSAREILNNKKEK